MKRACCAVAGVFFLFVSAGIVFAQSPGGQDGRVDRRIASPSYGLNLGFFAVEYEVSEDETESETVAMPGFDVRHFNGINVSERGGFYYGYEVGLSGNFYGGGGSYDTRPDQENVGPYRIENIMGISVFLMGKHGYRAELVPAAGVGAGFELGLGVLATVGSIKVSDQADVDLSYEYSEETISPVVEAGFEGSFRPRQGLRFVGRLSAIAGAPAVDATSAESLGNIGVTGTMLPVRTTLRFGFTLDH